MQGVLIVPRTGGTKAVYLRAGQGRLAKSVIAKLAVAPQDENEN